ncbi:hypothetical protein MARA_02490 (plasmid) [Mycolicibacterium arabiense]|uniref:Uncharacterized protein n=1 Tax=Mycolicibacterium arabiense TaxID=1286181 RepID=A0A7I7RS57_9MYCO|nr:hypothetical protein MARA_02490 [Mycolicibacterium arabiense]
MNKKVHNVFHVDQQRRTDAAEWVGGERQTQPIPREVIGAKVRHGLGRASDSDRDRFEVLAVGLGRVR